MFALLVLLLLLLPGVLLIRTRAVDDRFLTSWAQAHALRLTPANQPMVWWYLRNARLLRNLGVIAGFLLPPLVALALTGRPTPQAPYLWVFVGYLVGALYAEVSLVRPRSDGPRAATLASREIEHYLPRRLLVAQRVLAISSLAAAGAILVVPFADTVGTDAVVGRAVAIPMALTAAAIAAALPVVQRWLIRRPQPFVDPELLAADDAIRSQSVHSVAGSGLAIVLAVLTGPLVSLGSSELPVLQVTMWSLAALTLPAGVVCCLYYGHRAWRVPRPGVERRAVAAP